MTGCRFHLAESERRKPLGLGFLAQHILDDYTNATQEVRHEALSLLRSER